ncbi:MAG: PKD domain-containing protein [Candidatus Nanohaloarchaea archaeon]
MKLRSKLILGLIISISLTTSASAFEGGDGSSSNPYEISTCQQLQNMNPEYGSEGGLTDEYELVDNIDCSDTINWNSGYEEEIGNFAGLDAGYTFETANAPIDQVILARDSDDRSEVDVDIVDAESGTLELQNDTSAELYIRYNTTGEEHYLGFNPIGQNHDNHKFKGDLNGNYHTIDGLYIDRNGTYTGLMGDVDDSFSDIENIGLTNANISGNDRVGGLVGHLWEGEVKSSFVEGVVSGEADVGGLVGENGGDLSSSFSEGVVSGETNVGGLVGENRFGQISSSFSSGNVFADAYPGGLVGDNYSGSISSSYWDLESFGEIGSGGGKPLNTSDMHGESAICHMHRLDFENKWVAISGDYPNLEGFNQSSGVSTNDCTPIADFTFSDEIFLPEQSIEFDGSSSVDPEGSIDSYTWKFGDGEASSGETASHSFSSPGTYEINLTISDGNNNGSVTEKVTIFSSGDGSSTNPYPISTCYELQAMQNNLSAYYELSNDVECTDTESWNYAIGMDTYLGFNPVGPNYDNQFLGGFQGNNYTINGLYINRYRSSEVGMFGYLGGDSSVKNVALNKINVTGASSVGGLIGYNEGETISSVSTGGIVSSKYSGDTGGLIGYVGFDYGDSISNSRSTANVSGAGYSVGGLIGGSCCGTSISNTSATGDVYGESGVGGLIGYKDYGSVSDSYAVGDVTGAEDATGGLIGENFGSVSSSYAAGDVNSPEWAGGLIGNVEGSVSNSYATGDVNGSRTVGGLVGHKGYGSISDSYSTGKVSGERNVSGLIGENEGSITSSYWDINSSEQTNGGNLNSTGLFTGEMQGMSAKDNMGDMNFNSNWSVVESGDSESICNNYPILKNVNQSAQLEQQNCVPLAYFDFSPSSPRVGGSVTFDASSSNDLDGSVSSVKWDWDKDGLFEENGETTSRSFPSPGNYSIAMQAKDDAGAQNLTVQDIEVVDTNTISIDWASYSSSADIEGFNIYYGVGAIKESNVVDMPSSEVNEQISDSSWGSGDQICVEVRPYNVAGEADSDEVCATIN